MKYNSWNAFYGCRSPQLQIQITPLQWHIGGGFGGGKIAFVLGPIAFALWYKVNTFEKGVTKSE